MDRGQSSLRGALPGRDGRRARVQPSAEGFGGAGRDVDAGRTRQDLAGRGLVGAYGFDAGSGATATDASGNRNVGAIRGANWTTRGRFHRALRFDGGDVVRVPASASLNLSTAMTLSAWVRPTESQSGWRTVLARQTDAYFLTAGGGRRREGRLQTIDGVRVPLLIIAAIWSCLALAGARTPSVRGRRLWYWPPVALFVAGSAVDAALTPSDTLIGPTLVALWFAMVASRRGDVAVMWVLVAAFAGVTVVSVADPDALALGHDHGGIARSAALGLLIATAAAERSRVRSVGRTCARCGLTWPCPLIRSARRLTCSSGHLTCSSGHLTCSSGHLTCSARQPTCSVPQPTRSEPHPIRSARRPADVGGASVFRSVA